MRERDVVDQLAESLGCICHIDIAVDVVGSIMPAVAVDRIAAVPLVVLGERLVLHGIGTVLQAADEADVFCVQQRLAEQLDSIATPDEPKPSVMESPRGSTAHALPALAGQGE